jgi:hypothetical protein
MENTRGTSFLNINQCTKLWNKYVIIFNTTNNSFSNREIGDATVCKTTMVVTMASIVMMTAHIITITRYESQTMTHCTGTVHPQSFSSRNLRHCLRFRTSFTQWLHQHEQEISYKFYTLTASAWTREQKQMNVLYIVMVHQRRWAKF